MSHTFTTRIELGGKTATGFPVPDEVVEAIGAGKKPKVVVHLNNHHYRSTVAVYAGRYMLPLSAENRSAAGVEAGETVEVTLDHDTAERRVELPADLAAALDTRPGARSAFDALSFSRQRQHTDAIAAAKHPETRQRRIMKTLDTLTGN